jgi:hypothetical protein
MSIKIRITDIPIYFDVIFSLLLFLFVKTTYKIKHRSLDSCLFDHEQSRSKGYYKHSNHLQTTKTNNKRTRQNNLVFNITQNDIQYFPSFIKQTC